MFAAPQGFMGVPRRDTPGGGRAAILGLPFDCGTDPWRIGARHGPEAIRRESRLLRPHDPLTGLDPLAALGVVDLGDAPVRPGRIEESFAAIEAAVHAIALPEMRALRRAHPGLVTVHVDAHTDAYPIPGHNTATAFARAAEEGVVDARHSFQVGLRGQTMVPGVYAHGRALGYTLIPQAELLAAGIEASLAALRRAVGDRPVYLSWDMDVFDPAVAPGVCTPTWGGLSAREGLAVLEACAGLAIVGMNVNTVSPPQDPGGMTALLAGKVALEGLGLIARRAQG